MQPYLRDALHNSAWKITGLCNSASQKALQKNVTTSYGLGLPSYEPYRCIKLVSLRNVALQNIGCYHKNDKFHLQT